MSGDTERESLEREGSALSCKSVILDERERGSESNLRLT